MALRQKGSNFKIK